MRAALAKIDREAWVRFFAAIGGLALAFTAAVFSTVFRYAGNVLATALLASAALLLAGLVAVISVPYLARRVVVARMRDAFDYDVTREGAGYLILVLVVGVAALNTGNNLLFIVVAAMLASILISGIASAALLRGLELDIALPQHVFARRAVWARFKLRNRRRVAPAFSVTIAPPKRPGTRLRRRWVPGVFAFPPKRPPERQWVRIPDLQWRVVEAPPAGPRIFDGAVYFPYIAPGAVGSADVELNFARRGRYRQDALGVATRFPFSFLVKTRRVTLEREIVVYPSVEETDELLEILPMITGEFEAFVSGRGHDLYRIREYMPEDSARHVDWKASARSGALKVREFTREDERRLRIVFDNPAPGAVSEAAYERGVMLAASLAWHFAAENTELEFMAQGCAAGQDVYGFLRHLALAEPAAGESMMEKIPAGTDDYNVIVTARPRGSIPTALWACSYFVFMDR
ncbi:MAG TPA: DUF58 domain-containing protein [Terriglobales bacterium]|nr:DUF58 domain-containing protein [Terriglobales bacterium]